MISMTAADLHNSRYLTIYRPWTITLLCGNLHNSRYLTIYRQPDILTRLIIYTIVDI